MADPIYQSSYSQKPAEARLGQLVSTTAPSQRINRFARGKVKAGYGLFKPFGGGAGATSSFDPGAAYHMPEPGPLADASALKTTFSSSASTQQLVLDGSMAGKTVTPARLVTFTFSSHADWDATSITLSGLDEAGKAQSETIAIPNGGNATVTSTKRYSFVNPPSIPAQSGTGGTATIGVAALDALAVGDFLGVGILQLIHNTISNGRAVARLDGSSTTATADYCDGETVPVLSSGGIWVYSEEAIKDRDPVYVRVAAGAGGSVLGAFRNDADSASCVLLPGARFRRDSAGAGPAWVNLPFYA